MPSKAIMCDTNHFMSLDLNFDGDVQREKKSWHYADMNCGKPNSFGILLNLTIM